MRSLLINRVFGEGDPIFHFDRTPVVQNHYSAEFAEYLAAFVVREQHIRLRNLVVA